MNPIRLHVISILILTLTANVPVFAQIPLHDPPLPIPVLNKLNLHFTVPDLALASHDLPIAFTRTYNSSFDQEVSSSLGQGWTHSYNISLKREGEDLLHPDRAVFTDSTGRRYAFERTVGGFYVSPPLIKATLEEALDQTSYTLTFKDKTRYFFNQTGRLESIETKNKNTLRFTYNEANQLVVVTSSAGGRLDFSYDSYGLLTQVTDSAQRKVRYLHEGDQMLTKAIDPLGAETTYRYDEADWLVSIRDPLNREVKAAYSDIGNLQSMTDPEGRATTYEFISSGYLYGEKGPVSYFPNTVTATDPLGNKTVTEYNDLGNPLMLQDKEGNKTFYTWDRFGDLTGVIDPERGRTELVWEFESGSRNLVAVVDPVRNRAELLYDDQARLIEFKDPKGSVTEFTYDPAGHLTHIRNPEAGVTQLAYTPTGEVSATQDPLGHATTFSYNALGQPLSTTDVRNHSFTYRYNERNELTQVTNPKGEAKVISYDLTARQRIVRHPDGREYAYRYDKAGRLISAQGPEGTIQIEYNALDLPIRVTDADGKAITYEYDPLGRRTKMVDQRGSETRYSYDKVGNLIALTPPTGETIQFEYDKAGRRTAVLFPNSVKASTRYDLAGNVLELRSENLQTKEVISRVRYYYDELGNCVSKIVDGQGETTYTYDKLSRLVEVVQPDGETTVYAYDKAGNRLAKGSPGVREDSTYNELNQLLTQGKTTYQYDPAGHLVIKQENEKATRYRYDFDGLLEEAILPDGRAMEYRYDPLGRRISKATPEGTTRYAYDAEDIVLEFSGENKPAMGYIHGPGIDDLLSSIDQAGNEASYFLTDRLGSITAVLDQAGTTQNTFTYDPFGQVTSSVIARSAATKQSHIPRFTGRELDPETGLYYYRNRYYAPDSGRFTTPDPLGLAAGPNLYAYVNNNPINLIDPWGLDYWIEGSSPGEPSAHQSINVGDPNGEYSSYSFGVNENINWWYGLEGQVYRDPMKGGPILPGSYRTATPQEDAVIKVYLENQVGATGPYALWSTCRTWSQSEFLGLTRRGFGKPSENPPVRNSSGQQSQSIPLSSSTITSGEPYGFPSGATNLAIDTSDTWASVPEPPTFVLVGLGLAVLGVYKRRRRPTRRQGTAGSVSRGLIMGLGVIIGVAISLILVFYISGFHIDRIPADSLTDGAMHMIKRRALRYAKAHNRLPVALGELPIIPGYDNSVRDAWGRPIIYVVGENYTVKLVSYGKDGRQGGTGENADMIGVFAAKDKNGQWQTELCSWTVDPLKSVYYPRSTSSAGS